MCVSTDRERAVGIDAVHGRSVGIDAVHGRFAVGLVAALRAAGVSVVVGGSTAAAVDLAAVVLCAPADDLDADGTGAAGVDVRAARRYLDQLDPRRVGRLVVMSSALVYGARSVNPLPLTEESPARPNPGCAFAAGRLELEVLATEWAARAGIPLVICRPTVALHNDRAARDWFARSVWSVAWFRLGTADPPFQALSLRDLVAAVCHVISAPVESVSGVLNLAPDGWLDADRRVALEGRRPFRVPEAGSEQVETLRARSGWSSTPADLVPYAMDRWVVSNERLRASGFEPSDSTEAAIVAAGHESWWGSLSARRRQEVLLGGLAALGTVVAAGVVGVGGVLGRKRR
jgi:nucleoside-diphosphate-sugar epimerase